MVGSKFREFLDMLFEKSLNKNRSRIGGLRKRKKSFEKTELMISGDDYENDW